MNLRKNQDLKMHIKTVIFFICIMLARSQGYSQSHSWINDNVATINWQGSKFPKIKVAASNRTGSKDTLFVVAITTKGGVGKVVSMPFEGIGGVKFLVEELRKADSVHNLHDNVTTYCLGGTINIGYASNQLTMFVSLDDGQGGSIPVSHFDILKLKKL